MPTSASSTASTELFARAKRDIDLPGFLAAHGWQGVPNHDSRFCRSLRGPDGSHLIVSRAPDGHWVWFRDGGGGGGSIVDAVGQLLGVSTWGGLLGVLRRALASPPPPLPVAVGSGRRTQSLTATADPMQTHTVIGPLSERGRAYLNKGALPASCHGRAVYPRSAGK